MSGIYEHYSHAELQNLIEAETEAHSQTIAMLEESRRDLEYLKSNLKNSALWPSTMVASDQKTMDGRPSKIAWIPNWCVHKIRTLAVEEFKASLRKKLHI